MRHLVMQSICWIGIFASAMVTSRATAADLAAVSRGNPRSLQGMSITGVRISPTDACAQDGRFFDAHPVDLGTNKVVTVAMDRITRPPQWLLNPFDPQLVIVDAAGNVLAFSDTGGQDLNAKIQFRSPVFGRYWVIATTSRPFIDPDTRYYMHMWIGF